MENEDLTLLLRECALPDIGSYKEEAVRNVLRLVRSYWNEAQEIFSSDGYRRGEDGSACKLLVTTMTLQHAARTLHIYHRLRVMKITRQIWSMPMKPTDVSLSSVESDFASHYRSNLKNYMANFKMDLTTSRNPPKDLFVMVRVLKDCGEVELDDGVVSLNANTFHFLKRSKIDHLLKQGFLLHVN